MTVRLDIEWAEADVLEQQAFNPLARPIAQDRQYGWCPECNAIIQTCRHKLCGVCGEELPNELLFTDMEAWQVKELVKTEQAKHRNWMSSRGLSMVNGSGFFPDCFWEVAVEEVITFLGNIRSGVDVPGRNTKRYRRMERFKEMGL